MLLRGQIMMKFKLEKIEEKQNTIMKMLIQKKESLSGEDNNIDYYIFSDLFPLKNIEDLNQIESKLIDIGYRTAIIRELSYIGGKTVASAVKKMIVKMFDDELLSKFTFAGRKSTNKKCFQSLKLYKIIDEATKKITKFKECLKQEEIDDPIKYMLVQAPFRIKRKPETTEIASK
ncbi:Hypothetical protein CINCED_3A004888 [Cinara cedri]|nr:Hypothetical protein CINCED_3A004888 [Cinara cedri]